MARVKMLRLIEIMQTERKCVLRADTRGRDCARCALLQNDDELVAAYDEVIQLLESFYTRSDQLAYNLRTYGRERQTKE